MSHQTKYLVAKPFLKWAGGKSQLLSQFQSYYPMELVHGEIRRYVEPFVGGGAVFLDVVQQFRIETAVLIDINPELILAYRVVQQQPSALVDLLHQYHDHYYSLQENERKGFFYEMRNEYNAQKATVDLGCFSTAWVSRAAHMLLLNKTCFNGLYRVNSRGEFNVPFGRYKKPAILDEPNILRVSELLQMADIVLGDFRLSERFVDDRTFVYFDPPYRPISTTSSFTSYSKDRFDDGDQRALGRFFAHLDANCDARLMLSNSDPTNVDPQDRFFDDLYSSFHIRRVYASRMINSRGDRRGKISEVLVTNYRVGT